MNKLLHFLSTTITAIVLIIVLYEDAHAYVDPASGSFYLQMALAALFGASYVVKVKWHQIKSYFNRSSTKDRDVQ